MNVTIYIVALSVTCFWCSQIQAQKTPKPAYKVIVNALNPVSSMKKDMVSRLFLKKATRWPNGEKATCVDLASDSPVRKRFSKKIHGREVSAIKAYWQKKIFSGRGVPVLELGSEAKVLQYVHDNPQAVGYVAASTSTAKYKVKVVVIEN